MRVVFLAFDSGELSVRTASALADLTDISLLLPQKVAEPHLKWLDSRVSFVPFDLPRLRHPVRQFRLMVKLVRMIRDLRPDVVHMQKWHLWFYLVTPLLGDIPLVISIHDPLPHLGDRGAAKTPLGIVKFGYRRADRVIAHNDAMKAMIEAEIRIPADRIDIVPLVERGDDAAVTVLEPGPVVLFFGRIWEYKGLSYFIAAEPMVSEAVPDARFVIAGRGDAIEPYIALMEHPDRFEIHNEFVPYEKREQLFQEASVVALPYVEATQSGVIPIAYTHRRPVVATDVGGLSSQVEHGVTGFLVPPRDAGALAEAIVRILRDPELRVRMGESGRSKLEREWSASAVAGKTFAVYQRTLSRRQTA